MINNKINYVLPDFTQYSRNEIIISLFQEYNYIFNDKISLYSFYGVFPGAIWNGGGHIFWYRKINTKEMKKVREYYNNRGIVITFTFTNQLITEEHLNDEYCNQMLKVFHNGMNEVLVVSPVLEKYIRENYPKYKINRSIINTEKAPFLLDNYHLTVLSKFKNKDFDFLKSLSIEERSRTELLCDEFCINDCPHKYKHYKEHAYIQLHGKAPEDAKDNFGTCKFFESQHQYFKKRLYGSKYRITYEDILNTYLPLRFKYFKLSGRGYYNTSTTIQLVNYLIKPEYQQDVLIYLLERMIIEYMPDLFYELKSEVGSSRIEIVDFKYI